MSQEDSPAASAHAFPPPLVDLASIDSPGLHPRVSDDEWVSAEVGGLAHPCRLFGTPLGAHAPRLPRMAPSYRSPDP